MQNRTVEDINMRTVARRHLIYYLRVFNSRTERLLGNLVDISSRGIMLVSDDKIPLGDHYELHMTMPESVDGSRDVKFHAIAKWCRNDVNPDFFDTGFELVDPDKSFLEVVDKLVEECLFKE